MPMFSVRCEDPAPMNPAWNEVKLRIKARTKNHAMRVVSREYAPLKPLSATAIKSDKQRDYWRGIWAAALANMPAYTSVKTWETWDIQPSGSIPVGKYIKGLANDTIRQDKKGRISQKKKHTQRYTTRREKALTRILKYTEKTRWGPNAQVLRGVAFGTEPRDAGKRQMLINLGKPDGQHLALKLLSEPYRQKGDDNDSDI